MQDYLARQASAAKQFAELLTYGDLDAPVSSCPGWTLTDLADHLGGIHQWATYAVRYGNPDAEPTPAPRQRAALVDWYQDAAATLLSTLTGADPSAPAWTFGPRPRTVGFWYRRQAHESTLHLWDAALSQQACAPIDGPMARDGIDELVTMFFPRQVRLGRTVPLPDALAVVAKDPDETRHWVLAGDGTGPAAVEDAPAQSVPATIQGPAEALLLALWRRVGLDDPRLRVTGDPAVARAVLAANLAP